MKMTLKYGLLQILFFGLILTAVSCGQKRVKDSDELVLTEYVIERDGIYYDGNCDKHAKIRFTGECKFYHENRKLKGVVKIKNGLPTGHWKYWDSAGLKTLDLIYENGTLIKKKGQSLN